MRVVRYADRPDLQEIRFETLTQRTFPEYMNHNEPGRLYWSRLYGDFPDFQLGLLDGDELVAELHSVPTAWDGTKRDLPDGWDEAFLRAFESGRTPDVLCALAISVRPDRQGEGLACRLLNEMRSAAGGADLRELIAPVRPTLKSRYPLIPIDEYMAWRRPDGNTSTRGSAYTNVSVPHHWACAEVDDDRSPRLRLGELDRLSDPRRRRPHRPGNAGAACRSQGSGCACRAEYLARTLTALARCSR